MSGNRLAETVADVRKARYEGGTGGDATFVSGDVMGGRVRKTQAAVLAEDDGDAPRDGDDNDE